MRILIVDDNPVVRFVHQRDLSRIAYIESAETAETAIDLHQNHPYDFILMDVNLPGMSGIQATQAIRAFDQQVHIFGITARIDKKTKADCLAAGMNKLFIKPIPSADIRQALLNQYYDYE